MPNIHGEISRGEPGRLSEQLTGKVWLGQCKGQWPVTLMTSESQVITWLAQNRDGVAWQYDIKPVGRVEAVHPEPYVSFATKVDEPEESRA